MPIWGGNQDKGGWAGLHIHRCDFFERTARQAVGADTLDTGLKYQNDMRARLLPGARFCRIDGVPSRAWALQEALPGRKTVSAEEGSAGPEPKTEPGLPTEAHSGKAWATSTPREAHQVRGTIRDLVAPLRFGSQSGRSYGHARQGVDQGAKTNPGTATLAAAPPAVRTPDHPPNLDCSPAGFQGSPTPPAEKTAVKPR